MNSSGLFQIFKFSIVILFLLTAVFLLWDSPPKTESATRETQIKTLPNYDIRLDKSETAKQAIEQFIFQSGKTNSAIESDRNQTVRAETELRSEIPNLKIESSEDLRIPELVSPDFLRSSNFLTAPSDKKRADILQNFINQNAQLFGLNQSQLKQLEKTADYTNPDGNLSFVQFEQKINLIPVFRG